jgi:elongation factor P hydroxylase
VYTPFGIDAVVVVEAIALVTDGSYSRKICSEIDGAGWMIYCKSRRKVVFKGSFYEWCATAGSYRGELLGLLVVHLLVMAVEIFYDLGAGPRGLVACDNLGGLNKSR